MANPRSPKGRTREVARRLQQDYPEAWCALVHRNPFELLATTILSAQTTDERVNMVTPELFARYPTAPDLAGADPGDVERIVRSTGFYQNKTKSLIGMAAHVVERFGGEVPSRLADLVTLPGVGRKTANVVRSVAFELPGLPVDTHVGRLSRRLALTEHTDPGGRAGAQRLPAAGRAGPVQPAADPARPGRVPGPLAALRVVCAGGHLPLEPAADQKRRRAPRPPTAPGPTG